MTAYGQKTVLPDGLYCMYLRKSREDAEMELHGAGDTLLRHEHALMDLAKKLNINKNNTGPSRRETKGKVINFNYYK